MGDSFVHRTREQRRLPSFRGSNGSYLIRFNAVERTQEIHIVGIPIIDDPSLALRHIYKYAFMYESNG